jgi:SAM-dependent methyltransferase
MDAEAHPNWKSLEARHKGRLKFSTGDAAKLAKIRGAYDLVFEKDMLHHVPDPTAVLAQMKSKLKPGGLLVAVEANRFNPVFYVHLTLMGNHQHFTPGQLRRHFEAAGMLSPVQRVIEARVWPLSAAPFQDLMDSLQDLAEEITFLKPWLCYNAFGWRSGNLSVKLGSQHADSALAGQPFPGFQA